MTKISFAKDVATALRGAQALLVVAPQTVFRRKRVMPALAGPYNRLLSELTVDQPSANTPNAASRGHFKSGQSSATDDDGLGTRGSDLKPAVLVIPSR